MEWLYRLGTGAYYWGIALLARLGKDKAQKWVAGRKPGEIERVAREVAGRPTIWLHAASLGEYEQGRPVLEWLRRERPDHAAVVTFFSPSGYERRKHDELIDVVAYLPKDVGANAGAVVQAINPSVAVFVKYEFWYYHLRALHERGVPTVLIAGSFRANQAFFRWYGGWYRRMLDYFDRLLVQTEADRQLLLEAGVPSAKIGVTGDPRTDRVHALATGEFADPVLDRFTTALPQFYGTDADGRALLIAGSVWPPDAEMLLGAWPLLRDHYRIVLAPHELQPDFLAEWEHAYPTARYTRPDGVETAEVLILDTVGILSRIYRYGDVAYVGGGFRTGLHNTLEPLAYRLPTLFGPRYAKFPEATEAIRRGGAFSVNSSREAAELLLALRDPAGPRHENARRAQDGYLRDNLGAARRTAESILRLFVLVLCLLPLTSARAQSDALLREALHAAFEKGNLMSAVADVNWHEGICLAAAPLAAGETIALTVDLRANVNYAFIGSGAHGVTDLDLRLYTPNNALLAVDTAADNTPIVNVTATRTGPHVLQLHFVNGRRSTSAVSLAVLNTGGHNLLGLDYNDRERRFFASARQLAASTQVRPWTTPGQWSVLGILFAERQTLGIDGLQPAPGRHYVAASTDPAIRALSLLLANDEGKVIARHEQNSPFPLLEFSGKKGRRYDLLVRPDRGRMEQFLLLGFFEETVR